MKVLFLISRFLDGGIDTVLVEVLRMLAEDSRYELTLAIATKMEGLEVYHDRLPARLRVEYLVEAPVLCRPKVRRFKRQAGLVERVVDEALLNPVRRLVQRRGLRRLVAEHDVVVDFDACHTAFLRACPRPTLAWVHFSLRKMLEQNARRTQRIVRRLRGYDRVVLICKAMQDEADALFPELQGRTAFIYNALDAEQLRLRASEPLSFPQALLSVESRDSSLAEQTAVAPFPYILAVERLEESQKDIRTLLEAYAQLRVPEHLIVVGKGKDEQRLKDYAHELGLDGRVHFVGFQPNPYQWMSRARLLVHSAKFEGFGLAIAEALLLGLPIVATDCPVGPREILAGGRAGLLTPVGDAAAMAAAIGRLLSDEALRRQVLLRATLHARTFTKEQVKPQLDALFAQSCGAGRAGTGRKVAKNL